MSERPTLPPSADEAAKLAEFETAVREDEQRARLENVAEAWLSLGFINQAPLTPESKP